MLKRGTMEPRSARSNVLGAAIAGGLVLFFSFILLFRDPLVFWNDDYQISILPVFADVARSWGEGHWPLLSPYSWACGNLAGEFQYGTFSVFINAAVVLIWKIFHGFAHQAAALSIVHLVVLATGGYILARSRGISMSLSTMVSLIAALNGWIICWGASDWFGALGAFAWIPWAWWGLEKSLGASAMSDAGRGSNVALAAAAGEWSKTNHRPAADATKTWTRFVWPAPFVYLVATGGFPYTIVMLGLLVAWLAIKAVVRTRRLGSVLPMLLGTALGFGLAAPAILALLAYVHGSAREAQPASAHWQWIVPPSALPALILPNWTVNWADFSSRYLPHRGAELACGLVAPAVIVGALLVQGRRVWRRLGWELALLGIVLIAAMLPTAGVFRWSFRWLPFFHLILALCAAECLATLGRSVAVATVALGLGIAVAIATPVFGAGGDYALPLIWILLGLALIWTALEYWVAKRHRSSSRAGSVAARTAEWIPAAVTFASLLATYLCIPPNCGVPRFNFTEALLDSSPLDPNRLYLSVYPPAETAYRTEVAPRPVGQTVRPGSTSMWGRLHFINGYSPIRPSGVAKQFFFSIHGETDVGTASWLLWNEAGAQGLLSRIGIDGITVATVIDVRPLPVDEWDLATTTPEGRVYHRKGPPYPRVRAVESIASRAGTSFAPAKISGIVESRDRIEADLDVPSGVSPALISISRPYFEGYRASLGGQSLEVSSDRGLYPVLEVPAGTHGHLVLSYRPAWLLYGCGVAGICALVWLWGVVAAAFRKSPNRRE